MFQEDSPTTVLEYQIAEYQWKKKMESLLTSQKGILLYKLYVYVAI